MSDPLTLCVHNDIKEAAKWYKIPSMLYKDDDVYILQADRCVFVGSIKTASKWLDNNKGRFHKSIYPLTF